MSKRSPSRTPSKPWPTPKPKTAPNRVRFKLHVKLTDTGEVFTVPNCCRKTTVSELKTRIELIAGIPIEFLRLSYLDKVDLQDKTTVKRNNILPETTLTLSIWPYQGWPELVKAAVSGDIYRIQSAVFRHFVTLPQIPHRLFSALFISAHRGKLAAVCFLLEKGADIKGQTPSGRRVVHAAAASCSKRCLEELYAAGGFEDMPDSMEVASILERRSMQYLSYFQWKLRTVNMSLKHLMHLNELHPYQHFDSQQRTWQRGPYGQMYMVEVKQRDPIHLPKITSLRPSGSPTLSNVKTTYTAI
ncbi:ankyrin repeat domain-containing protein 60-like [Hoplias malabaricus]|uniref:ankyrin repeat domain-containing protein 60-like n=1 Tax=Hoplias malabaricus TaxID=27720 RepID=UPI00346248C3